MMVMVVAMAMVVVVTVMMHKFIVADILLG